MASAATPEKISRDEELAIIVEKITQASTLIEALKESQVKIEAKRYLHDIRNLQSQINYLVSRLTDEDVLDNITEYTNAVGGWIQYQETLINRLTESIKAIASGGATKKPAEPIALQARLAVLTTMLSVLIKEEKEGSVKFHPDFELPRTPILLHLDGLALERVIMNLIGNAIKFTTEGFIRLTIKAILDPATHHAQLAVSVRDTGIGMTGKECSRIFQEGVQANAAIKTVYGGTGIGLAYCKDAVIEMGGESIAVKSKKRVGEDAEISPPIEDEDTERVTRTEEPDWGTKFSFKIQCTYSPIPTQSTAATATTWKEAPPPTATETSTPTPNTPIKGTTPIAEITTMPRSEAAEEAPKPKQCCIVQ